MTRYDICLCFEKLMTAPFAGSGLLTKYLTS